MYNTKTKNIMLEVYNKNLNIYSLLNKLKKESKVGVELPEGVLVKVCESFLKETKPITNSWAWFTKAVINSWHEYNAEKNIRANKKEANVKLLKELFK
jgi:hypothetical protein